MATGLTRGDGQRGVQQKHALIRPEPKIGMLRRDANVVSHLFENIAQRTR
tara:strand:- start:9 stop:158 length:150 start_codon:yes stop_codon:yes gene_type:complete